MYYPFRFSKKWKQKLLFSNGTLIFCILKSYIIGFLLSDNLWYAAIDNVIDFIYAIHPTTEPLVVDLRKMSLSCKITLNVVSCVISFVPVTKLSRYLFIVFHVSINQLAHLVSCVQIEILINSFWLLENIMVRCCW